MEKAEAQRDAMREDGINPKRMKTKEHNWRERKDLLYQYVDSAYPKGLVRELLDEVIASVEQSAYDRGKADGYEKGVVEEAVGCASHCEEEVVSAYDRCIEIVEDLAKDLPGYKGVLEALKKSKDNQRIEK